MMRSRTFLRRDVWPYGRDLTVRHSNICLELAVGIDDGTALDEQLLGLHNCEGENVKQSRGRCMRVSSSPRTIVEGWWWECG